MLMIQAFTIQLEAMGKPRATRFTRNKAVNKYHAFSEKLRLLLRQEGFNTDVLNTAFRIDVCAKIQVKPSWTKKKKLEHDGKIHQSKPDIDNIFKAVTDSMYYGTKHNDSNIAQTFSDKYWTQEPSNISVAIHT